MLNKMYNKIIEQMGGESEMNVFKRRIKVKDERIENVRNQIYKEMYYVVLVICFVSMVVTIYKYGHDVNEFILELLILFLGGVYYLARSIYLGVFWDEVEMHDRTSKTPMSTKTIYRGIGFALIIAILMGINSAFNYADTSTQGLLYFGLVLFVSVVIYLPIFLLLFGGIYFLAKKISLKNSTDDKK
jgi:hypothetical protein